MDDKNIDIVAKKKHSLIKNEDTKDAVDYIATQIKNDIKSSMITLLFNTVDVISGTFKQSVQKVFSERTGINLNTTRQLNDMHTNYQGMYIKQNPYGQNKTNGNRVMTPNSMYKRNVYDYENVEFDSRVAANLVLERMKKQIQFNGYVEVGMFYQAAGLPYTNVDLNYGWTNLDSAVIQRQLNQKWIILMPKAIEIEKD